MHDLNRDEKLRLTALDRAITSGLGNSYNDLGISIVDAEKIITAAKKFEEYLKGDTNG